MKKLITVGIALTVLGAISTTIFGFVARDALQEEIELTQVTYNYQKDDFQKITLSFQNNPIVIQKSLTEEIIVKFNHDKFETVTETKIGDALTIKVVSQWYQRLIFGNTLFNIANAFVNRSVYVALPEVEYDIYATSYNGGISVKDLNLANVVFRTDNGEISANNVNASALSADTSNGKVDFKNVNAAQISTTSSNGGVYLNNVVADSIEANTSNGSISALNITSPNLKLITSNGNVTATLVGAFVDYRVRVSTSLGNIKINNQKYSSDTYHAEKTPYINAETSNGNINISFSADQINKLSFKWLQFQ